MLLALPVFADGTLNGQCDISFDAQATMHDFQGKVKSEAFPVTSTGAGDEQLLTWKTEVSPKLIKTGEGGRDEEVQKTLKFAQFALMSGSAGPVSVASLKKADAELPFELSIAGITQSKKAVITAWKQDEKSISFNASFDVSMKDFGLKPKSMMGLIRVHDVVRVTCHFTFAPPQS